MKHVLSFLFLCMACHAQTWTPPTWYDTNNVLQIPFVGDAYVYSTNNATFTVSNYVATPAGTGWTNSTARRGLLTVHFGWSTSAGSPAGATLYITNYDGTVVTHPWYQGGLTGLSESGTNFLSGMIGSNSSVNLIGVSGTITVTSNNIDWQ